MNTTIINVNAASEGYHLFEGLRLRMGFWGDKPEKGEEIAGYVKVRPQDPPIPFFRQAKKDERESTISPEKIGVAKIGVATREDMTMTAWTITEL